MNSYSKIFKASHLSVLKEVKVLSQTAFPHSPDAGDNNEGFDFDHDQISRDAEGLLVEAKAQAQSIIDHAVERSRSIEAAANEEISRWWAEKQADLELISNEAKQQGYQEGLDQGKQEAELIIQQDYQEKMEQVQQLLQQAYVEKERIISEAEPFLLELSTVIASQILKQELETYPEKLVELIKEHLLRFKEKESISVCVHPDDFELIQSQRAQLIAVVNGETEIKIIPDHSVSQKGCIIRTDFGSVDARIDTQIEEIKKVILETRRNPDHDFII